MLRKLGVFKNFGIICLIPLAALMIPSLSLAQAYPTKTIELITPYPPGGLGPLVASMVAEEAKKYLNKPVIVVHKPGAAGVIGSYYVAKAAPDGYTLLIHNPASITTAHLIQKFEFTPLDFEVVGGIVAAPVTLTVRTDAPWKTLTDLIRYAKANPGLVTCGNPGTNSATHLHAIQFERFAGIKLNHVPFKGSADAVTNLAGGHTQCVVRYPGEGEPLVEAGKVRNLSVFDSRRCKFYPNAPTSKEEGFDLVLKSWRVIMAPKGTPKPILATWEDILRKTAPDQAFIAKADKLKLGIEFRAGEDVIKDVRKDMKEFSDLVKELNLKEN
jgi:tripartite-type tricarboxylate transporter receptor subunit TctC